MAFKRMGGGWLAGGCSGGGFHLTLPLSLQGARSHPHSLLLSLSLKSRLIEDVGKSIYTDWCILYKYSLPLWSGVNVTGNEHVVSLVCHPTMAYIPVVSLIMLPYLQRLGSGRLCAARTYVLAGGAVWALCWGKGAYWPTVLYT